MSFNFDEGFFEDFSSEQLHDEWVSALLNFDDAKAATIRKMGDVKRTEEISKAKYNIQLALYEYLIELYEINLEIA